MGTVIQDKRKRKPHGTISFRRHQILRAGDVAWKTVSVNMPLSLLANIDSRCPERARSAYIVKALKKYIFLTDEKDPRYQMSKIEEDKDFYLKSREMERSNYEVTLKTQNKMLLEAFDLKTKNRVREFDNEIEKLKPLAEAKNQELLEGNKNPKPEPDMKRYYCGSCGRESIFAKDEKPTECPICKSKKGFKPQD